MSREITLSIPLFKIKKKKNDNTTVMTKLVIPQ